ncbi:HEPN domain-containing protein [Yersinia pekkanenii]|uniref:HEPN domain-containing protein n=1 Tax=Yersinia pekkanenii TaxID=1288385 RepID=A0A0T9R5N6_9GAMM|nr:HEPN domain-containing protein [Yersinia pekkanenii]CNI46172.1 Uncharacterised protein [Yersinia pekkanenii]CRY65722.1 Uncharacterised protein [Yersinia pekkanenii]
MSINSSDFLYSAVISCDSAEEVDFRNAISRAYYAMYHESLRALTCLPGASRDHHACLIKYMSSSAENKNEPYESSKLKSLSYRLKQQRNLRNQADYKIDDISITQMQAKVTIKATEKFFEDWGTLKSTKNIQKKL